MTLAGCPDEKLAGIGGSCGSSQDCASGICSGGGSCLDPDGDEDLDSLSNSVEANTLGSDPEDADTDNDGVPDGDEVAGRVTDAPDTDGDGKPDWFESLLLDSDGDCIPDQRDARDDVVDDDFQFLTADYCPHAGVCGADDATLAVRCDAEKIVACVFDGVPDYEASEASCDGLDNNCDGETDEGLAPCEAQLTGLAVDEEAVTVALGRGAQLTALASYDDNSSVDVTADATWSSDDESVVTVAAGALTPVALGTTTVHAAFDSLTVDVDVTVGPAEVDELAISLAALTVSTAHDASLTLEAQYSDGSTADVTDVATWASENEDIATVSAGLVTGVAVGEVVITASYEGAHASATLTVVADGCDAVPCENGAACVSDGDGGFSCTCAAGYEGDTCAVDIDDCADAPCQHGGDCVDGVDAFTCQCPNGWTGAACEIEVNGCDSAPCQHGGLCADEGAGAYSCTCGDAWTGDNCDVDANECDADPCDVHANCVNSDGGFTCTCQQGWAGTGTFCANVNECLEGSDDCLDIADCSDTLGGYDCACPDGYTGDGRTACDDVNECDAGTAGCDAHATCTNTPGGATCACDSGYSGDGHSCSDVNECFLGTAECAANAACTNTVGGYTCACESGYTGDGYTACDDVNECQAGTAGCDAHASCTNTVGGAVCACEAGWAGDGASCINVNECLQGTADCLDLATCADTEGGYTCTCKSGYSGDGVTACDDVDECDLESDTCDTNASCSNTVGSYTCTCSSGYSGDGRTCLNLNECSLETDDCDPHASCTDTDGGWTCACDTGYSGDGTSCSNIDDCASQPCQNGGTCVDGVADFTCQCPTGFAGELCEINVNGCEDSPCQHGGVCTDGVDPPFTCACPDGYYGTLCELNIDECATSADDCDAHATCADTDGGYTCTCKPGWDGDGTACTNINECQLATDNCSDDATCTDTDGGWTCACNHGYAGDGVICSNVDECQENTDTCDVHATCADTDGGYTCTCKSGWTGDGESCANVNECGNGTDTCDDNATCTDTDGGYTCTCKSGWTGDGESCANVNECQLGTDGCSDDAICTDTDGAYTCRCKDGYEGNGVVCDDIDECQVVDGACDPHATCQNTPGSYSCTCDDGWSGDGSSCSDIDECLSGADDCDPHATCDNTPGAWTCTCDTGWAGSGKTCSDIDECQNGDDDCDTHAICDNTPGGWTCTCDTGWTGTGQTCSDVNECVTGANDCDSHATCTNTPGLWTCACDTGWTGTGQSCSDIDECGTGDDDCDPHATCSNTPGGWDCACDTGWTGTGQVCGDVDECQNGTAGCDTHATCGNTPGGWTCTCDPGWAGDGVNCGDVDECAGEGGGNDCGLNSTCQNTPGGYECPCNSGYHDDGQMCVDNDECLGEGGGSDCDPNASCTNTPGSFDCACKPGYFGDGVSCSACTPVAQCAGQVVCSDPNDSVCQDCANGYELSQGQCVDIDECALDSDGCTITQTCTNTPGGFTCTYCPSGYENDGQEVCVDVDECARQTDNCDPVAACANTQGGWTCTCPDGTWGDGMSCTDCTLVTHCTSELACTTASDSVCTACVSGYEVVNGGCEDVDECALGQDSCGDTQLCTNTDGGYTCTDCDAGYWNDPADGVESCVDRDECAANLDDCDANANCTNIEGGYLCTCHDGYFGDGTSCAACTAVANCQADRVTCTSATDSQCRACVSGWELNANGGCSDIDECYPPDANGRCEAETEYCVNTDGSYICEACDAGYWNFSEDEVESCVDIDECELGQDDCSPRATCTNTDGGWDCTCVDGYWGSGQTCAACTSVSGCRTGKVRCTSADDSICLSCQGGYTLNPDTQVCDDIDECALDTDTCSAGQICSNTAGSFTCEDCPAGYENDGQDNCVDIDECATGAHDCASPGGVCRNTAGSYACDCYPGYTGPTCGDQTSCTLYVDQAAAGGEGASWGDAALSFDKLPPVIGPLCDVWVAQGTYTNSEDTTPVLQAQVGVGYYGGFSGGETSLDQRDPDAHLTLLDGEDNVYNVVTLADGATVDGFSVTRGYARNTSVCGGGVLANGVSDATLANSKVFDNAARSGGGVCVEGGSGVIVSGVEVSANSALRSGGGILVYNTAAVSLVDVLAYDNTALGGGAVTFNLASDAKLTRATLMNNATVFNGSTTGGALLLEANSNVTAEDVTLRTNQADHGGGVAVIGTAVFDVENLVAADNSANRSGGNIYLEGGSASLVHATVTAGHARGGAGIHCNGGGTFYADASILWANDSPEMGGACELLLVTHSISVVDDPTNIALAPMWVGWPTDLRLWSGSPAIDRVSTSMVTTDIRGLPRVAVPWGGDQAHDLGAYEFQRGPSPRDPYIWYVSRVAQGANKGLDWKDAFLNLEPAFESAQDGDRVWVAGKADVGITYRPESYGSGGESTYVMPAGVALFGGFDASNENADLTDRDPWTFKTILSCDAGEQGSSDGACGHVLTVAQDDRVDGFTIRGGYISEGGAAPDGAGILGLDVGTLVLGNLDLTDNISASGVGGGIYIKRCDAVTLQHSLLQDNHATGAAGAGGGGGGLAVEDCSQVVVEGTTLTQNSAVVGGGIYVTGTAGVELRSSSLVYNDAVPFPESQDSGWGGGFFSRGSLTATNTLIANNMATVDGPAGVVAAGQTTLYFTTVAGHRGQTGSLTVSNGALVVKDTVIWPVDPSGPDIDLVEGSVTADFSDISGSANACGAVWSCNQVSDADPLFASPSQGNYRLTSQSPLIDKAAESPSVTQDLDGTARPQLGGWDIGCYEYSSQMVER